MTHDAPPRWLERILIGVLSDRDRETISGDLLEEYRERRLRNSGRFGANLWYARQIASFISRRVTGTGLHVTVALMSLFVALAGCWLCTMELILRHPAYGGRCLAAGVIILYSLLTLVHLSIQHRSPLRWIVALGAMAVLSFGASALYQDLHARHFEGYILIIAAALIMHGALTLASLGQRRQMLS